MPLLAGRGKTGSANCERRGGSAVGEAGSPERRRRARSTVTSGRRRRRRRRSRPLNRRRSASRAPVGRISFCERGASLTPNIYLKNRQKIHKCQRAEDRVRCAGGDARSNAVAHAGGERRNRIGELEGERRGACWRGEAKQDRRIVNGEGDLH